MTLTRGYARNAATTPKDSRLMDMGRLVCNADGSPRAGVLGNAGPAIVSTTGTMNVAIAAAEFATSRGKADGVMVFTNDGVVNVAIAAAPVSNSRIDVIYVKHNDNGDGNGDANALPTFGVLAGVAAAAPTKPGPLPVGALELATLRIYSGTTATNGGTNLLTNTYAMTAMRGGVVPFRTTTERDAWSGASGPVDGQLAYVIASDATFQYLATAPAPGWYHAYGAPEIGAIAVGGPSGFWVPSASGGTPQMRRQGGLVLGFGSIMNTTNNLSVALGTEYNIASISDVAFRPDVDRYFATGTSSNAIPGVLRIAADGTIYWRANATATWVTGSLRIDLGGIIYNAKGIV